MSPLEQPAAFNAALLEFLNYLDRTASPSRRVTLHAARIGGGAAAAADARRGGEPAFRPGRPDFDDVAAAFEFVGGFLRHAAFEHQHARVAVRGQNELGKCSECQAGASIDSCRFMPLWTWRMKNLRDPLILAVAAGRAPGEIRLAVAQRHGRRQRGARPPAGAERGRMAFFEPEHLRAGAEAEAELGDDRRRVQPAAGRRRRDHVAGLIDDVEMHGVAALLPSRPTVGSPAPSRPTVGSPAPAAIGPVRGAVRPPRRSPRSSRGAVQATLCR